MARYFAVLLVTSGVVSAAVHPLPNLTEMSSGVRAAITLVCVLGGALVWCLPWDRWPRSALMVIPPIGLLIKMWANLHGGLGPYSYSIHFVLIYVWMGVALPRGLPLKMSPLLAFAYALPLLIRGDPRAIASLAMVIPICVLIGESVAWISNRLREVEQIDGRHMHRMQWLVQSSIELADARDQASLASRIATLASELPGTKAAAVLLLARGRTLSVSAQVGWSAALPDGFALGENPTMLSVFRSADDLGPAHPGCVDLARELSVPRLAISKLEGSARCLGLVLLIPTSASDELDAFDRNVVRTFFVQAGLAVEGIRDRESLRDASLHDELTRLGNRRKANERIARLESGDALAMIDLDHFKRVNDEHGHAGGDRALIALARHLERNLRDGDQAYRIGGEEFLVVLGEADAGAWIATERLRRGWQHQAPITTFSAGVAIHRAGETPEETLARADHALYEAKNQGRNRVVESDAL